MRNRALPKTIHVCVIFFSITFCSCEYCYTNENYNDSHKLTSKQLICNEEVKQEDFFDDNGKITKSCSYINPISFNCQTFFENGAIKEKYRVENGQKNGKYFAYYVTGKPFSEGKYFKGKLNGFYKEYHSNGALSKNYIVYNEETVSSASFDSTGKLISRYFYVDLYLKDTLNASEAASFLMTLKNNTNHFIISRLEIGDLDSSGYVTNMEKRILPENDSILKFSLYKLNRGNHIVSGCLFVKDPLETNPNNEFRFPFIEQYFCK